MERPGERCALCRDAGLSFDELARRAGLPPLPPGAGPEDWVANVDLVRGMHWPGTPPGHGHADDGPHAASSEPAESEEPLQRATSEERSVPEHRSARSQPGDRRGAPLGAGTTRGESEGLPSAISSQRRARDRDAVTGITEPSDIAAGLDR